eukprot:5510455-Amphidinium_carterae.1
MWLQQPLPKVSKVGCSYGSGNAGRSFKEEGKTVPERRRQRVRIVSTFQVCTVCSICGISSGDSSSMLEA